jgi:hypothetical protein
MTQLSKSPDRNTFQKKSYIEKLNDPTTTEEEKQSAQAMIELYEDWNADEDDKMNDPEWQKNNLEYDLLSTDWILEKVRESNVYAQHLYSAMCNREFQQLDVIPILKGQTWSCSWRHAGGIIADMQQKGDYIDWYCSGIRHTHTMTAEEFHNLTEEQQMYTKESDAYVGEGFVTDEIEKDLKKLGWIVLDTDE